MIYSLIHNPFFLNALIAAVLAAVLCSMIGTYVVTRRMVIMGGGMAHASLGGVGLGAYFGFSPLIGAAAFCLRETCSIGSSGMYAAFVSKASMSRLPPNTLVFFGSFRIS